MKASDSKNLTAYRNHLADAIQCLQVVAGIPSSTGTYSKQDVNENGNIGLEEAIHALQSAAGGPSGNDDSFTNSLGMTFKLIPDGFFIMGSPTNELGRSSDETLHEVMLTKPFYMQITEVTQGQWQAVMGSNPSNFENCGSECPVEQVSWDDAQDFIAEMNKKGEGVYRLPTEAEWEYAARAGTSTALPSGDLIYAETSPVDPNLDAIGWYGGNSDVAYADSNNGKGIHPSRQKSANAFGLYDMHGNVWEWCLDWFDYYPNSIDGGEYVILLCDSTEIWR